MPLSRVPSSFTGTTRLASPAANTVAITTSSAERLRITSAGDVGIGTDSPQAALQITRTTFPVLKVADNLGGGAVALGDSTINNNFVGVWRGVANSISGGGFLNIQGNGIAFMSSDNVFGSGTERMRIDSSGNVGIGTSSPTYLLDISGTSTGIVTSRIINLNSGASAYSYLRMGNNADSDAGLLRNSSTNAAYGGVGSLNLYQGGANPIGFVTDNIERMRIASNGFVSIGGSPTATSGSAVLVSLVGSRSGGASCSQQFTYNGGTFGGSLIGSGSQGGGMEFYTFTGNVGSESYSERMRITSGGTLVVGATSQIINESAFGATSGGNTIAIKTTAGSGAWCALLWNSGTSGNNLFIEFNTETSQTTRGSIVYNRAGGVVAYNTTSDYRLKENIVNLPNALQTVANLKPRQFDWKETGNTTTGFIAHELAEVLPYAVTGEKDALDKEGKPQYQGIDTSFLVATLTAAIQEQQAIIASLTSRIEALENQ
jgi:hypothetical protein